MKVEFQNLKEEIKKIAATYPYKDLNDNLKIIKGCKNLIIYKAILRSGFLYCA